MIGEGLDFAMEHYPYAILCKADFSYYQEEFRKILDRIYSKTDRFQTEELGTVYVDLQDLRRVFNNDAAIATSLLNTVPYTMSPRIGISVGKFPARILSERYQISSIVLAKRFNTSPGRRSSEAVLMFTECLCRRIEP